jgi:hypothetical protein
VGVLLLAWVAPAAAELTQQGFLVDLPRFRGGLAAFAISA